MRAPHGRSDNRPMSAELTAHSRKTRAAALSVGSNAALIVLKLVAAGVTGSIALLTDAVHSSIDLLASFIALFAIRKADQPADESHPYGHEKAENLAAAFEGLLILVGAAVIVSQAWDRLAEATPLRDVGFGVVVVAISLVANLGVSTFLRREARLTDSAALEGDAAHLRADAMTSGAVLGALLLVEVTGTPTFDPAMALLVAVAIVVSGIRIVTRAGRTLLDESLPDDELVAVWEAIEDHCAAELESFHKVRARRAGSRRHVDLHAQFRAGTSLERAHEVSHELKRTIETRFRQADVLIHLEPTSPGGRAPRRRAGAPASRPISRAEWAGKLPLV